MPAIARGNKNGIEVLLGQEFAKVRVGPAILIGIEGIDHDFARTQPIFAAVTDGDETKIGLGEEISHDVARSVANANGPKGNAAAGGNIAGTSKNGGGHD